MIKRMVAKYLINIFMTLMCLNVRADANEWIYKDWSTAGSDGMARYVTPGSAVHGHQLGFVKKDGQCNEDILWISWSTQDKGIDGFRGKEAIFEIQVDGATSRIALDMVATSHNIPLLTVMEFSNYWAGPEFVNHLQKARTIKVRIVGPTALAKAIDIRSESFSLNGFIANRAKAQELCENKTEMDVTSVDVLLEPDAQDVDGCSAEARDFDFRIKKAIKEKDVEALFALVDGELSRGPRKAFALRKTFDELFTDEWREKVITDQLCGAVGWRGYMIGNGKIWFNQQYDTKKWTIKTINGALEEDLRDEPWVYKWQTLNGGCFTTMWLSSDNYEHFHGDYAEDEEFDGFFKYIGRYIGRQIPIEPVPSPWGDGEFLSLAVSLKKCTSTDDEEKTYQTIKEIPQSYCKTLAPNYPQNCNELRLVTVIGPCGGSMGCDQNTGIYGIVDDPKTKETYVVPLTNFYSENEALNYIDEILK